MKGNKYDIRNTLKSKIDDLHSLNNEMQTDYKTFMQKHTDKVLGFLFLFIIWVVAAIVDLVMTYKNFSLLEVIELNPIFNLGGFWLIVLANILGACFLWWAYNRKGTGITLRFILIFSMVAMIGIRIFAIYHASWYLENNISIEQAKEIATPEAIKQSYTIYYGFLYIVPLVLGLFSFLFFKADHQIKRKDLEENA